MHKVLIIGSNGQLAFDLIKVFKTGYLLKTLNHQQLDITNKETTLRVINSFKPNTIINTAAYHNTTQCEENPKTSFEVNAIGAYNVSFAANQTKARVVFFSTDYVFDGIKKSYDESSVPNPLNIYGASKAAGEALVKLSNPNHLIIRTGWLYGEKVSGKGHNFVTLMLKKAREQKVIEVVSNQYGSPTYTYDLALKLEELIQKNVEPGTYHLVNGGNCSWYEFAKEIFRIKKVNIKVKAVHFQKNDLIKRPKYSILKSYNLKSQKITSIRPWKQALNDYLKTSTLPLDLK